MCVEEGRTHLPTEVMDLKLVLVGDLDATYPEADQLFG